MSCGRARRVLFVSEPRVVTPEMADARVHVEQCPGCAAFLIAMRRMELAVRDHPSGPEAPTAVRERLFKTVARARTGAGTGSGSIPSRRLSRLAVAMVLLVGLGAGGVAVALRSTMPSAAAMLVEDHAMARGDDVVASTDPATVSTWLAERLDFAVTPPSFPDARLTGARICHMRGARGAVVTYDAGGVPLSFYVLPESVIPLTGPDRSPGTTVQAGFRATTWRDRGLSYALVANLPEPRMTALAHFCLRQMLALIVPVGGVLPARTGDA